MMMWVVEWVASHVADHSHYDPIVNAKIESTKRSRGEKFGRGTAYEDELRQVFFVQTKQMAKLAGEVLMS